MSTKIVVKITINKGDREMWYCDKISEEFKVKKVDRKKEYYEIKYSNKIVFKEDATIESRLNNKRQNEFQT